MGLCFATKCYHTNKSGCKMFNFPKYVKLIEKWELLPNKVGQGYSYFTLLSSFLTVKC